MSQVSGDLSKIMAGPCRLTYGGRDLGHTIGGCLVTFRTLTRERTVDEYAGDAADLIHDGDEITVKVKLAERSTDTLSVIYPFGVSATDGWGIGVRPGGRSGAISETLVVHPLDGDGANDDVVLNRAIVHDQGDVEEGTKMEDELFDCTFLAVIDDSADRWGLLGGFGDPSVTDVTDGAFLLSDGSEFTLSDGSVFVLG